MGMNALGLHDGLELRNFFVGDGGEERVKGKKVYTFDYFHKALPHAVSVQIGVYPDDMDDFSAFPEPSMPLSVSSLIGINFRRPAGMKSASQGREKRGFTSGFRGGCAGRDRRARCSTSSNDVTPSDFLRQLRSPPARPSRFPVSSRAAGRPYPRMATPGATPG